MSAIAKGLNARKYGRLLARALPTAIETEDENERALAQIEELMDKGESRSVEEDALLKLLVQLVQDFEERSYPIPAASGREVLVHLMESRALKQRDLLPVFGSSGVASEVINGKRAISKTQARKLSEIFHVPADTFI